MNFFLNGHDMKIGFTELLAGPAYRSVPSLSVNEPSVLV